MSRMDSDPFRILGSGRARPTSRAFFISRESRLSMWRTRDLAFYVSRARPGKLSSHVQLNYVARARGKPGIRTLNLLSAPGARGGEHDWYPAGSQAARDRGKAARSFLDGVWIRTHRGCREWRAPDRSLGAGRRRATRKRIPDAASFRSRHRGPTLPFLHGTS